MKTVAILIPALNPDRRLIAYVHNLITYGFQKILIIDDGSNEEAKSIFSDIASFGGEETDITILEHAVNLGKGRALKDGINYYLTHLKDQYRDCYGVITVDSDGQHNIEDVIRVSEVLACGKKYVLRFRIPKLSGSCHLFSVISSGQCRIYMVCLQMCRLFGRNNDVCAKCIDSQLCPSFLYACEAGKVWKRDSLYHCGTDVRDWRLWWKQYGKRTFSSTGG